MRRAARVTGEIVHLPVVAGAVAGIGAAALIAASGLNDEEIADWLTATLLLPIRPTIVGGWRAGWGPEPAASVIDLLVGLRRRAAPPALGRVS